MAPSDLLHGQRSLDDLGTPLYDVTFCVIDLETTGGDPGSDAITEVGAARFRGGECLGTFQTMVNPGQAIPPAITVLTGITQGMVHRAPRIESVLPSLLEFVGDAVVVGHNIRFDTAFLDAALRRDQRDPLHNVRVDTVPLARRLLGEEVPNCRLGTLADRLRLDHKPTHRALDDVLATADLLHHLLERAGRLGVTGLDDLLALPKMAGHPQAAKLRLTDSIPRSPGIYLFRDRGGRVLYVGKATNLRARVRSYFSSDTRRKVSALLRETDHIDHQPSPHTLHAAVSELRTIHQFEPRFNRQGTTWRSHAFLTLTLDEPFPRLSVVRQRPASRTGRLTLGPVPGQRLAKRAAEAIESVVPLRRCTARPSTALRSAPCAPAQLGVAACPCAGAVDMASYRRIVSTAVRGLTTDPSLLLAPLTARMTRLAAEGRFEEAADVRDRGAALSALLSRQRRLDQLRGSGRVEVRCADGGGAVLDSGLLTQAWGPDGHLSLDLAQPRADRSRADMSPRDLDLWDDEERWVISMWLARDFSKVRLEECSGTLASPATAIGGFEPRVSSGRAARRAA